MVLTCLLSMLQHTCGSTITLLKVEYSWASHTMSWVYLSASDSLIEWSLTLLSWNTQYFYYSINLRKYRIFQILVVLYLMQMYSSLDHSGLCLGNACKQATRLCVTCTQELSGLDSITVATTSPLFHFSALLHMHNIKGG